MGDAKLAELEDVVYKASSKVGNRVAEVNEANHALASAEANLREARRDLESARQAIDAHHARTAKEGAAVKFTPLDYESLRKRVGKFRVSMNMIKTWPASVMTLMAKCVILRAEMLAISDEMEYLVVSPELPEVSADRDVPSYAPVFRCDKHWRTEDLLRFDPISPRHTP
jgi:hypothetical protein